MASDCESRSDCACGEPATGVTEFFDDNGRVDTVETCDGCALSTCVVCSATTPPFLEFECAICEATVCAKCALLVIGVKAKPNGARHCLICIQPVVKHRMLSVGAKEVAE